MSKYLVLLRAPWEPKRYCLNNHPLPLPNRKVSFSVVPLPLCRPWAKTRGPSDLPLE